MGLFPMLIFCISTKPDSLKSYYLHAIRVIADQPESAIGTISQLQVSEPQQTVFEAMQQAAGVHLSLGTKDESNLRIRGFRKNEALILIDGRPLTSGYFGNVDLSKIILSDIQDIAVIKGPASAQFGSGSMGGVVNLISSPQSNLLTLSSHISRNMRLMQRISSAKNFGDFGYSFSLAHEQKPGFMLSESFQATAFENGAVRDHSDFKAWHIDAKTDLQIANIHDLGLSFGYSFIPHKDIPSSIYGRDYRSYKNFYRAYSSLGADLYSSENSRILAHLYYDAAGDTYERFRDPHHQSLDISSRMDSWNLGLAPSIKIGQRFQSGFRSEYRSTKRKDTGSYLEWTDNWAYLNSAYVQHQVPLHERLDLSASFGLSSIFHSKNEKPEVIAEPSLGLYWTSPIQSRVSFSVGRNSAMPTMRQLFSAENGNPHLLPSSAFKYEINHKLNHGGILNLVSDLSLFYNDVKNLIDYGADGYQNLYSVQSYGGEISLAAQPLTKLFIQSAYAYLDYGTDSDYRLSDSPRHSIDGQISYSFPLDLELSYSLLWRSERDSQDDMGNFHVLKAYHTHSIELGRSWKHLDLKLKLDNLLDEDYQSEYGYPAAGRDYTISISLKI